MAIMKSTPEEMIKVLQRKIEDLKKRMPAHSIPPTMIAELDELEEELEMEIRKRQPKK